MFYGDWVPDQEVSQQNVAQPKVEEFTIEAKLNGTMADIKGTVGQLPFYQVKADGTEVDLIKVESRSINKRPFLFHIIKIYPDKLTVTYSLIPDSSTNLRRAEIEV